MAAWFYGLYFGVVAGHRWCLCQEDGRKPDSDYGLWLDYINGLDKHDVIHSEGLATHFLLMQMLWA